MPQVLRDGISPSARAITPHNSTNFPEGPAAGGLYVGGAGTLTVDINGVTVAFGTVNAGTHIRVAATRVNSTGTTATLIVAAF
jgi:hypothetical protein